MPVFATTSRRRVATPAPAPTPAFKAVTADGVHLAVHRVAPTGPTRAVCLCTHAFMARARYFVSGGFARHLAARGIDTFVLDWRGHGASVPPHPGRGMDWSFDDYVELDLPAAVATVASIAGPAARAGQLTYVGHSLGAFVGLAALAIDSIALRRIVLLGAAPWLPGPGGSYSRRALLSAGALVARAFGKLPARRLGLGSDDEPASYLATVASWARSGSWTSRTGFDYQQALASLTLPSLWLSGARDRLSPPADVERFAASMGGPVELRTVGKRHGDPIDPDHFQLVTRRELKTRWDEIADFLLGGVARPRRSG